MSIPSDPTPASDANDDLQFELAEPVTAARVSTSAPTAQCAGCGRAIGSTYYAVGQKMVCGDCAAQINTRTVGGRHKRLGHAVKNGVGAAILGAIIWFVIRKVTGLEIGYVAILVGYMVGQGVFRGSGNRGGRAYQILAVVLTYASVTASYVPYVLNGYEKSAQRRQTTAMHHPSATDSGVSTGASATPSANGAGRGVQNQVDPQPSVDDPSPPSAYDLIAAHPILAWEAIRISLEAPFLGGAENIIGLLIIGFALWQAWKMNRSRRLPISGPYQIGQHAGAVV